MQCCSLPDIKEMILVLVVSASIKSATVFVIYYWSGGWGGVGSKPQVLIHGVQVYNT